MGLESIEDEERLGCNAKLWLAGPLGVVGNVRCCGSDARRTARGPSPLAQDDIDCAGGWKVRAEVAYCLVAPLPYPLLGKERESDKERGSDVGVGVAAHFEGVEAGPFYFGQDAIAD